jgi:excisionase family DNA binding protein
MEDLVKIGAASAALGVSVDTLRRWERDGRIIFHRVAGQRHIAAGELSELLSDRGAKGLSSGRNRLPGS